MSPTSRKRSPVALLVALAAAAAVAGCSNDTVKVAPPDELYRQATQDFVEQNYGISIQTYKYLLDHYPLDPRAEEVELRIADAHFADEAYPEAIAAYSDFQRMHPTSPRLPEVEYNIGKAYVAQMDTVDRDLAAAANAHARFESVMLRYPDSQFAKQAREELLEVREHLAERELYVARFYFSAGNHGAGRARAASLLATYPETTSANAAVRLVAADARASGDEELEQLAEAALVEVEQANAGAEATSSLPPSRTAAGPALQALRRRLAPGPEVPVTPPSSLARPAGTTAPATTDKPIL